MSFFKNYSQNGAAQALVVLGAFTVAAEIVRTRKTGKRPYRDYGVGGMNEDGSRSMFVPPSWLERSHGDDGVPHDMDDPFVDRAPAPGMRASDDDLREHSMDYMMARDQISRLGRRLDDEVSRLMDEEGMTQEEAMEVVAARQQARHHQMGHRQASHQQMGHRQASHQQMGHRQASHQQMDHRQASHQQMGRQQVHAQHEDAEGSMARAPSKWNLYVATEVPRLMAEGKTAAQAMKAASRTFRYAPRSAGGLGEPKSVKVDRKLGRGR
jgi:hypothetical protein